MLYCKKYSIQGGPALELLYLLEKIRCPFLDTVMTFFTYFGEELVYMVVALAFFWCVDKKEGCYLLFIGLFGTIVNQFLKIFCRVPRPWVRDPSFSIVESARAGATGYSFPSGHTQIAVGTMGGIARWNRKTPLRVACVLTLLLTGLSRMYLGVHTLWDVGFSLLFGALLVFLFYPLVNRAMGNGKVMAGLLSVLVACAAAFALYANFAAFPADVDADNLLHAKENSFSLLGALLGFCVAYPIERKYIRFTVEAPFWAQLVKLMGGLGSLLLIKEGLKSLFALLQLTAPAMNMLRYGLMVLFAVAVWPLIFRFFKGKRSTN